MNLEFPLSQPPQPHDYILPSYSCDFLLGYSVSSHSHPVNKISSEGVNDPSLHPLMLDPHIGSIDALGCDMVPDDAPFLLTTLRENNKVRNQPRLLVSLNMT